jgi:hypothetical protein
VTRDTDRPVGAGDGVVMVTAVFRSATSQRCNSRALLAEEGAVADGRQVALPVDTHCDVSEAYARLNSQFTVRTRCCRLCIAYQLRICL